VLRRLAALALALLAVLLTGCGGSDPDDAVRDYFDAVVARDGSRACAQLADGLRREIEQAPAVRNSGRSCGDVMELAAALNPGLKKGDVEELEIDVEQEGDTAVARLRNPLVRSNESIDLIKQDGDWKIATLQTRPQP
jgi:hypothetical protein